MWVNFLEPSPIQRKSVVIILIIFCTCKMGFSLICIQIHTSSCKLDHFTGHQAQILCTLLPSYVHRIINEVNCLSLRLDFNKMTTRYAPDKPCTTKCQYAIISCIQVILIRKLFGLSLSLFVSRKLVYGCHNKLVEITNFLTNNK